MYVPAVFPPQTIKFVCGCMLLCWGFGLRLLSFFLSFFLSLSLSLSLFLLLFPIQHFSTQHSLFEGKNIYEDKPSPWAGSIKFWLKRGRTNIYAANFWVSETVITFLFGFWTLCKIFTKNRHVLFHTHTHTRSQTHHWTTNKKNGTKNRKKISRHLISLGTGSQGCVLLCHCVCVCACVCMCVETTLYWRTKFLKLENSNIPWYMCVCVCHCVCVFNWENTVRD